MVDLPLELLLIASPVKSSLILDSNILPLTLHSANYELPNTMDKTSILLITEYFPIHHSLIFEGVCCFKTRRCYLNISS